MLFLKLKFLLPILAVVVLLLAFFSITAPRFCASTTREEVIEGIEKTVSRDFGVGHPCTWAFFGPDEITIVHVPELPLDDITEELGLNLPSRDIDHRCQVETRPPSSPPGFLYCHVDEFSFSDSYVIIHAGTRDEICNGGRRVERFGGVSFIVSPGTPSPVSCSFRLSVQFEDGEPYLGSLVLVGGPRDPLLTKYKLLLAYPSGNNMPIAGIIYDHEEAGEVYYLVTKMVY